MIAFNGIRFSGTYCRTVARDAVHQVPCSIVVLSLVIGGDAQRARYDRARHVHRHLVTAPSGGACRRTVANTDMPSAR